MFADSSGSIPEAECTSSAVFAPQSREELKTAVDACLKLSRVGRIKRHRYERIVFWRRRVQWRYFEQGISKWDVSSVKDMAAMFWRATSSNGDISKWDVSSVTNMGGMFQHATKFNGDISKWHVSSVTNMDNMLLSAKSFNYDISKWDGSSVSDQYEWYCMFQHATKFNGDISKWHVSSVTNMDSMLLSAKSFNYDISNWDV